MLVLKTSLLMCLQHMMEENVWHPVIRFPRPTLGFKIFTSFISLGFGSITCKSWGNQPSIPHSLKHRPHCPLHTGSTFYIFLPWSQHDAKFLCDGSSVEGREGREGETPGRASWVSQSTKAFLGSLPWSLQGSWKEEMIENRSKLTVRTSACWLLHPLHWADHPGGRCLHPDTRL